MLSFREYLREADDQERRAQPLDKDDLIRIIIDAIEREGKKL